MSTATSQLRLIDAVMLGCLIAMLLAWPKKTAQPPAAPSPVVVSAPADDWITWTPKTRTLLVTEHAPGDLLVCFKTEDNCKLIREWNPR